MEVFRRPLTLDRLSKRVNPRVGDPGIPTPKIDRVTEEYLSALASLPGLMQQGDGMRSLLGLLVPLVTSLYPIVFIDEPEAFLHPPQATALGRILGAHFRAQQAVACDRQMGFRRPWRQRAVWVGSGRMRVTCGAHRLVMHVDLLLVRQLVGGHAKR
ncbi:AAA family ATPase [Streptomyces sp. NPDC001177]